MKSLEQIEMEQMALAMELARQLGHDFSNYLYNIMLQLEIWEVSRRPPQPAEYQSIKDASKKMAGLLQQWQQFRNRCLPERMASVDLHALLRHVADDLAGAGLAISLPACMQTESLWIVNSAVGITHLLRLLLDGPLTGERGSAPAVSMATEVSDDSIVLRMRIVEPAAHGETTENPSTSGLVDACCQSLAMRMGAIIHREHRAAGESEIQIEFARSTSAEKIV